MWRHGLAIPACAMVKLAREHATVHYVIIIMVKFKHAIFRGHAICRTVLGWCHEHYFDLAFYTPRWRKRLPRTGFQSACCHVLSTTPPMRNQIIACIRQCCSFTLVTHESLLSTLLYTLLPGQYDSVLLLLLPESV